MAHWKVTDEAWNEVEKQMNEVRTKLVQQARLLASDDKTSRMDPLWEGDEVLHVVDRKHIKAAAKKVIGDLK